MRHRASSRFPHPPSFCTTSLASFQVTFLVLDLAFLDVRFADGLEIEFSLVHAGVCEKEGQCHQQSRGYIAGILDTIGCLSKSSSW